MSPIESDESLGELLESATTIAVIGIKDRQSEDAFRVPLYMQRAGYRIVPVNPKLEAVLDETCHPNLTEVSEPIDIVNLFRASEHVPGHVDEILSLQPHPKAVWMQLGIHHGESAQRLREAGIEVVQDRCIMVDHRRLLGGRTGPEGRGPTEGHA
ncbi:MAG: CoA-binding protein [bacterium]|nr:CoA-binding protein [Deltaproteobacteria bacterium]MCP4905776.1 CoA-binding protein [bacterium]